MRKKELTIPSTAELEKELKRIKYKEKYGKTLKSTVFVLITVAAAAVLVAVLFLPVLQIYGSSMTPTLGEGDIVLSVKGSELESGDLVSFYIGNKLLVKRYIAGPGEWVFIDEGGNVYVNDKLLDEPYITEKAFGDSNIEYPYQVPENRIFVLGDHRSTSVDSRNTTIGCISAEQIVGKIVFRVWPLNRLGTLD
ncbi:MAG: signal peptidase I [Clostridia bacterium]|nr:signal peptidase I [Clostridia bacterium]